MRQPVSQTGRHSRNTGLRKKGNCTRVTNPVTREHEHQLLLTIKTQPPGGSRPSEECRPCATEAGMEMASANHVAS